MAGEATEQLRAYVEYFRDLGIHDFYRQGEPLSLEEQAALLGRVAPIQTQATAAPTPPREYAVAPAAARAVVPASRPPVSPSIAAPSRTPQPIPSSVPPPANLGEPLLESSIAIPKPVSFDELVALPMERVAPAAKAAALQAIQTEIGDCTRCPLAYAGRHNID